MDENKDNNVDTETMRVPAGYAPKQKMHTGPIIGILVIVLVLILAGLYIWGSLLTTDAPAENTQIVNNEPETPRADADVNILNTTSTSDEIGAIEADLSATNLDSLSTDFVTLESELDAIYAE